MCAHRQRIVEPRCHARSTPFAPDVDPVRPTSPLLPPLPSQWLVWVHLAGTVQAARICFLHLCPSPALSGAAAQAPLRRMAAAADALRGLLPIPAPLADTGALDWLLTTMVTVWGCTCSAE